MAKVKRLARPIGWRKIKTTIKIKIKIFMRKKYFLYNLILNAIEQHNL